MSRRAWRGFRFAVCGVDLPPAFPLQRPHGSRVPTTLCLRRLLHPLLVLRPDVRARVPRAGSLAKPGARPSVEMAMVRSAATNERRRDEVAGSGWSTAFSHTPSARASTRTARSRPTARWPRTRGVRREGRRLGTARRLSDSATLPRPSRVDGGVASGATTVTRAPASRRTPIFRSRDACRRRPQSQARRGARRRSGAAIVLRPDM